MVDRLILGLLSGVSMGWSWGNVFRPLAPRPVGAA